MKISKRATEITFECIIKASKEYGLRVGHDDMNYANEFAKKFDELLDLIVDANAIIVKVAVGEPVVDQLELKNWLDEYAHVIKRD